MLKRVYIHNFRCFLNFEYKPERKQLLLGANGSGKSSLLEAIRAIKDFVRDIRPDASLRLFRTGKTRWLRVPKQEFEIEAELGGGNYLYRLELEIERGVSSLGARVLSESLKVDGRTIMEILDGQVVLYPIGPHKSVIRLEQPANIESSLFRTFSGYCKETSDFFEWVSEGIVCLKYNPFTRRTFSTFLPARTRSARPALEPDLSNITSWYRRQTETDIEGVIKLISSLQEIFGGSATLNFGDSAPDRGLAVTLNGQEGKVSYSFYELSDGQRSLIALYMILQFLIARGRTVFLDEPDNFVSLREIQPWLLAAEQAVEESKGQLVLISHHPEILNQWAQEYGLRFFREENGHVRTEKFKTDPDGMLQPSELVSRGWEDE